MSVQLNFDATNVQPFEGFTAKPAGWYNVVMEDAELKPTKDGMGAYLECKFNIVDGQYQGQKLFTRLNIKNANPKTVEIAYAQLSAIAHAVGVLQIADSSVLYNRPLKVKIKVRKAEGYEDQNEITSYKNINERVDDMSVQPANMPAVPTYAPPPVQAPAYAPPPVQLPASGLQPAQQPWAPPAQQQQQQWAPQAPAPAAQQQPWAPQAPSAPTYAPQAAPQIDPATQTWQAPAAQQPWQAPVQQPVQAPIAAQPAAPVQQPAAAQASAPVQPQAPEGPHPAQSATPPWMQPRA
jgi:hypothetical protein